jgi:hypothetical protein
MLVDWVGAENGGRFRLDLPVPERPGLPRVDSLLAGAAEVDITPTTATGSAPG